MPNILKHIEAYPRKVLKILLTSLLICQQSNGSKTELDSLDHLFSLASTFDEKGDYEKTAEIIRRTHQIRKYHFGMDSPEYIKSLINIARIQNSIWEYDSALNTLVEAEGLFNNCMDCDSSILGTILYILGDSYKITGDYYRADELYEQAESILIKNKSSNYRKIANLYQARAEIKRLLRNTSAAESFYNKSIPYIRKLENNSDLWIRHYSGLAIINSSTSKLNICISQYKKAIQIADQDSSDNALRLAVLYNNVGYNYSLSNEFTHAYYYLTRAKEIFEALDYKGTYLTKLHESIGTLYYQKAEYSTALKAYNSGLLVTSPDVLLKDKFDNPEINQIEDKQSALELLKSKIKTLEALYAETQELDYLSAAINTGLLSIEIVEFIQNNSQSYESKLRASEMEFDLFDITLNLINKAYQISGGRKYAELAFKVSEKSKSSVLLSSLRELDARTLGEIPDSLLIKEQSLAKNISFYKHNIYEESQGGNADSLKLATWNNYLFDAQHKHEVLIRTFEAKYPNYFNLKYDRSVSEVQELQKMLPRNKGMIQYSLSDSVLYSFYISGKGFNYHAQKVDESFYALLEEYLEIFHRFDFSKQSFSEFNNFCWLSNSLYNILLKPLEISMLEEDLVIIPDGLLSYLPFETLIKQLPQGNSKKYYRDLDYLLIHKNIGYAYSSTLFSEIQKVRKRKHVKQVLAFAPEYDSQILQEVEKSVLNTRQNKDNLYPIPGATEEVNLIKNMMSSDVFIGGEATEQNFRNIAGDYDILHLAMHTVIDNNNPLFSKLIFSMSKDTLDDGMLNTAEIFGLKLQSRMVVLSACNTSTGEFNRGEGVLSLARGFVYAGTPSLVMTMWEVEDKSGSLLMKNFYGNLLDGKSKSEALRQAKISFIENARPENSHPFFWSSFVVLGNTDPLFTPFRIYIILSISLATAGLAFILLRRLRKRH